MSDLLDRAVTAHGGLERWEGIREVALRVSAGGLAFASRFKGRALRGREASVGTGEPRTVLSPYPSAGRRGVFEAGEVRIEADGRIVARRENPRAAFRSLRRRVWWDHLDLLYFAGYALWNYVTAPFLLLRPGFEVREIGPWREAGEELDRLEVGFPESVPTHSRQQVFYFDRRGLLRRLDYTAEVFGSWAKGAHYCREHREFSGLVVPTRRRVLPRRRDGRARGGPTLVWIEIDDVRVAEEPEA